MAVNGPFVDLLLLPLTGGGDLKLKVFGTRCPAPFPQVWSIAIVRSPLAETKVLFLFECGIFPVGPG
jgi:hypothetical protein